MNLHPVHYGALAVHPFSGTHKQKVANVCFASGSIVLAHVVVRILVVGVKVPSLLLSSILQTANGSVRKRAEALSKR
jgi:hypothetical protein